MPLSNQLPVTVANPPASLATDASGATAVSVFVESPLAAATQPRVRRLTNADQTAKYPSDEFFKFADQIQGQDYVFFTRRTLRNA